MDPILRLAVPRNSISCKIGIFLFFSFVLPLIMSNGFAKNIPAFPGAEGFGSATPGGRGGRVLVVSNLNDAGPGSFRQAVEVEKGPRIVVFKTGGRLKLKNSVIIRNPFITIAGQTAPGDGFCLSNSSLVVGTHDVVVRGLRIRPGASTFGVDPNRRDGITISSTATNQEVYNVVVDHCSISWGIDENLEIWRAANRPSVHDITIQRCIISEALYKSLHSKGAQGMGMLVGACKNISIHHNLLAHNPEHNPKITGGSRTELINNVVYNWRRTPLYYNHSNLGSHLSSLLNNHFIPGPATNKISDGTGRYQKGIFFDKLVTGSKAYLWGNIGPGRDKVEFPEWDAANSKWVAYGDVPTQYRSQSSPFALSGVVTNSAKGNLNLVLNDVGAIWPKRDSVDKRIINDVSNRTGAKGQQGIINSQNAVGGWPTYLAGTSAADNDNDGMPNSWENRFNMNPNDPANSKRDPDGDSYSNIEEYINGTNPLIAENNSPPNAPPTVSAGKDKTIVFPTPVRLLGRVTDDNRPNPPGVVNTLWTKVKGPGSVSFTNSRSSETTATFSKAGSYILRLTANDGELKKFDEVTIVAVDNQSTGIAAFPGAEGFGSKTPGGRGGRILEVTNLNDSGPGSFRQAVEVEDGPRIVIFKKGGRVKLKNTVVIRNPYLTIAGQTAPGDGFCVSNSTLVVGTHDVIVRGLRVRPGDNPIGTKPDIRDGITISSSFTQQEVYNVVIDHCSISWAVDENLSIWQMPNGPSVHDITIQWCLISEALYDSLHPKGPHSMGMLVGYNKNISIHHNLIAHNNQRNPRVSGSSTTEIINNIVYNWRRTPLHYHHNNQGRHFSSVLNNQFIPGPATDIISDGTKRYRKGIFLERLVDGSRAYLLGNIGPGRQSGSQPEWDAATSKWVAYGNVPSKYRSSISPFELSGISIDSVNSNFDLVLENVGAIWPNRDSVDKRVINDVKNRTGAKGKQGIIDSQNDVGGWPNYRVGTPLSDNDKDGMPNFWEKQYGLNPNDPADALKDFDGDIYSNIEEYLNNSNPKVSEGNSLQNKAPTVNAGKDQNIVLPNSANLSGRVIDDNLPAQPGRVTVSWTKIGGPGAVSFGNSKSAQTTATFTRAGKYTLRLTADDGKLKDFDEITIITVNSGAKGIPAFPGAEGFGSKTPGGRGGRVIQVTNLNNSGPGSFRQAVEVEKGPRIVVFRTGGRIKLQDPVLIRNPFITIAGQTAPGDGICLSNSPLVIGTHDVVIRGLRVRPGSNSNGSDPDNRDGITISSSRTNQEVYNVILDHCSISWAVDENLEIWQPANRPSVHDITVQWCMSTEALYNSIHSKGPQGMGMLVGANQNISIHHNLFAHNSDRNPKISGGSRTEVIDNIIYNWRNTPLHYHHGNLGPHLSVVMDNEFIPGPATKILSDNTGRFRKGIFFEKLLSGTKAYLVGNFGPGRQSSNRPEWEVATNKWSGYGAVPTQYRSPSSPFALSGITTDLVEDNFDLVLENVGAVWPRRDSVDRRIVTEVINGTGSKGQKGIINSPYNVGAWPTYRSGTSEKDSDKDGMPNSWENLFGLNPNDASDGNNDIDGDQYTNIEEYLNDTDPQIAE